MLLHGDGRCAATCKGLQQLMRRAVVGLCRSAQCPSPRGRRQAGRGAHHRRCYTACRRRTCAAWGNEGVVLQQAAVAGLHVGWVGGRKGGWLAAAVRDASDGSGFTGQMRRGPLPLP